jgi:hypothetical protein
MQRSTFLLRSILSHRPRNCYRAWYWQADRLHAVGHSVERRRHPSCLLVLNMAPSQLAPSSMQYGQHAFDHYTAIGVKLSDDEQREPIKEVVLLHHSMSNDDGVYLVVIARVTPSTKDIFVVRSRNVVGLTSVVSAYFF